MGEEELIHWQKLAEISLNTCSTMFAIIFAILFGLWNNVGQLSSSFKFGFFIMTITFVIEAVICILALYGSKKEVLSYISMLAKISVLVMFIMIMEIAAMLSALLFM
jgi:hypothetical protein